MSQAKHKGITFAGGRWPTLSNESGKARGDNICQWSLTKPQQWVRQGMRVRHSLVVADLRQTFTNHQLITSLNWDGGWEGDQPSSCACPCPENEEVSISACDALQPLTSIQRGVQGWFIISDHWPTLMTFLDLCVSCSIWLGQLTVYLLLARSLGGPAQSHSSDRACARGQLVRLRARTMAGHPSGPGYRLSRPSTLTPTYSWVDPCSVEDSGSLPLRQSAAWGLLLLLGKKPR